MSGPSPIPTVIPDDVSGPCSSPTPSSDIPSDASGPCSTVPVDELPEVPASETGIQQGWFNTPQTYVAICPDGFEGDPSVATVEAGVYHSLISQQDADDQALVDAQQQAEAALVCNITYLGSSSYISYEGTATLFGITEFGNLSDPPKKYLNLLPSQGGYARNIPSVAFDRHLTRNYVGYNTSGSQTAVMAFDATGGSSSSGDSDVDSVEDFIPSTSEFQSPFIPQWIRAKRNKYIDAINLNVGESNPAFLPGSKSIIPFSIVDSDIWISSVVKNTASWTVSATLVGVNGGPINGQFTRLYVSIASGDQEPPDPITEGQFLGQVTVNSFSGGSAVFSFEVPFNSSFRFAVDESSAQPAQAFPFELNTVAMEDAGLRHWYYMDENTDAVEFVRYVEYLAVEDTVVAALLRATPMVGDSEIAHTSSFSGGISAESHSPISFDGVAVQFTQDLIVLESGFRYQWTVQYGDSDSESGTFIDSESDTGFFDATSSTGSFSVIFAAPSNKYRKVNSVLVEQISATPSAPANYNQKALLWYGNALVNGSAVTETELQIASDLADSIDAVVTPGRIRYFLPLIGPDLAAAFTPLYNPSNLARPTNVGFVEGDFSQATGLQGASGKRLDYPFTPGSAVGGTGVWPLELPASGSSPILFSRSESGSVVLFFGLAGFVQGSSQVDFWWHRANFGATPTSLLEAPEVAFYYGQRISSSSTGDKQIYKNGTLAVSSTHSVATDNFGLIWRAHDHFDPPSTHNYWTGRSGLFLHTNGLLTATEVADLSTALTNFMSSIGRI